MNDESTKVMGMVKIAKLEFKVTIQYSLWQNESSCDTLNEKIEVWFENGGKIIMLQDNEMVAYILSLDIILNTNIFICKSSSLKKNWNCFYLE